jgi:hypothetical protein
MRTDEEVAAVFALVAEGMSTSEIARRCGIPRSTVKDWLHGRIPGGALRPHSSCDRHSLRTLDRWAYAYLLGMYLGDGCISTSRTGVHRLRITLDSIYLGIVGECAAAMRAITPGRVWVGAKSGERAVEVSNCWKHWPCLFPQHGPGRKHLRTITLRPWQQEIVASHVERFIRGLIHSDGTRIVATERRGANVRLAPRYAFSNRSEDILALFTSACDRAGVHWTRASERQVAIYSKAAVARLDEFVGPKL